MRSGEEETFRKLLSVCRLGVGVSLVSGFVVGFGGVIGVVGLGVVSLVSFSFVLVGVVGGLVGGVLVCGAIVLWFGVSVRVRFRGSPNSASRHNGSALAAPRSLRWVRGLLPEDEGTVWWAEVTSCLAETPNPAERRRYVRSYHRNVPRLIWTSWTERPRASQQRELL